MSKRTRVWALVAALLVLPSSLGAAAAQPTEPLGPPFLPDFTLAPRGGELGELTDKLDARLPKLGVQNILAEANRKGASGCKPNDLPERPVRSFCFKEADNDTKDWYPQGVSTVADAQQDQQWGGKQPLLVSWYDHNTSDKVEKGVRVSFLDPTTNRYQHVLLVYPFKGAKGPSYEALTTPQKGNGDGARSVHAGGLVWYGNYLYVPDTKRGIRVFDVRKIMDLKAAGDKGDTTDQKRAGLRGGKYYGFGYRFVLPQVDNWENPGGLADFPGKYGCNVSGEPKFSSLSLDRSTKPDRLISSEYCSRTGDPNKNGRVARWPLNGASGQPQTDPGGYWSATEAYRLPKPNVQGTTATNGRWYLSSTGGSGPRLQAAKGGSGNTGVLTAEGPNRTVAQGVEDLSYWPGRDELWTVTEQPCTRYLYALPRERAATVDTSKPITCEQEPSGS